MKVVLDTNILVSALISPKGVPAQLLQHEQAFQLVSSEEILAELERVLHYDRIQRRYGLDEELIQGYLATIRATSEVVTVTNPVQGVSTDPDDDKFLACAVVGQADHIVSGDPHLTDLESYQGISILKPRQFLDLLNRQELAE